MKNILKFLICTITLSFAAEITDIDVSQRTNGSGIVDIYYKLADNSNTFPSFTISVDISFDNGQTYVSVSPDQLSGDVGTNVQADDDYLKHIEYQVYGGVFTDTAIVKIKGEGHFVVSQLPFAMEIIESNSAITTFEDENINYNYEIMRYELKNSDFVQWLETYSFHSAINYDSDPSWETGDAAFNCLDYKSYYYIPHDNPDDGIQGCTNSEALNYNPFATTCDDPNCCIYESNLGCNDSNAANYEWDGGGEGGTYNDCSCSYVQEVSSSELPLIQDDEGSWSDFCWYDAGEDNNAFSSGSHTYIYSACTDDTAINYIGQNIIDYCNNWHSDHGGVDCCTIQDDPSACVYTCDETYPWENQTYDEWPYVKVKDFTTSDIWYQGSSFNILTDPTPLGEYPVRFDSERCIDSALLTLYTDYYGLRVPTGGEWMKAARGDDQRCWPWMDGSCQTESTTYCSEYYSCLTDEQVSECDTEANDCGSECQEMHQDCMDDIEIQSNTCVQECFSEVSDQASNSYDAECAECWNHFQTDPLALMMCTESEGQNCFCDVDESSLNLFDVCGQCMDICMINGENSPHQDSSCDIYADWSDNFTCATELIDQDDDSVYDNPSCAGTYSNYVNDSQNCWNDNNECQDNLSECMGTAMYGDCNQDENFDCGNCTSIYSSDLDNYINSEEGLVESDFISYLFYDRFNFINVGNSEDTWPTKPVNYYDGTEGNGRDGRSIYDIYNMVGNVPEIVLKDSEYYLIGTVPHTYSDYMVTSFCSDQGWGDNQSVQLFVDNPSNAPSQRFFGVRLARTLSD